MEYKKNTRRNTRIEKERTYGGFATARFTDKPTVERAAKNEKCISLCVRHDTVLDSTRKALLTPRSRPL